MDNAQPITVTTENFQREVLDRSQQLPVLVDFWAAWCNPCQMLAPILAKLAAELAGKVAVAKVNTDEQQALALQFGVRSLPTVKLFRNGQAVDEFIGVLPENQVRAFLEPYLQRGSDLEMARAYELADAGAMEQALATAEAAHRKDPDNPRVSVGYAELLLVAGRAAQAEALLQELPANEAETDAVKRLLAVAGFARVVSEAPSTAALQRKLAADPDDSEARYALAAHEVVQGNYEQAMEHLFTLFSKDRQYGKDAAHQGLLAVFQIAGETEAVADYRRRLSRLLY